MPTTTACSYIDILSKIIDPKLCSVSHNLMRRIVGDYTINVNFVNTIQDGRNRDDAIGLHVLDANLHTVASCNFHLGVRVRECFTSPLTTMWYPAPPSDDLLRDIGAEINAYIADIIDQITTHPDGFRGQGAADMQYMDCSDESLPASIRCMGAYMQEHQLQSATLYAVIRYGERVPVSAYDQHGRNLWVEGCYGLRFRRHDRHGNLLEPVIDESELQDAIEDNEPDMITTSKEEAYAALAGKTSTRKIDGIYIRQDGVAVVSATIAWDVENGSYGIPYEEGDSPAWETEIAPVVKDYPDGEDKEEKED